MLHGDSILFLKIDGQFTGAQKIVTHAMIWGNTKFPDGSTMLLSRITLVGFPVVLRIFFCQRIHVKPHGWCEVGKHQGFCQDSYL